MHFAFLPLHNLKRPEDGPEVLTMWLANEALRRVKGSDVALLAASEPLWAAVAAMLFLGDAGRLRWMTDSAKALD